MYFFQESKTLPKNGHEFTVHWRRHCKTHKDKYEYLTNFTPEQLSKIFKAEISFGLLGEFINVLSSHKEEDTEIVIEILDILSKVKRFSLSIDFLTKNEKEVCLKLFDRLNKFVQSTNNQETVDKLSRMEECYGIAR